MIQHTSFDHKGGFYHYRIHNEKLGKLTVNFSMLKDYLKKILKECPNEYFNVGPRSSSLKFKLNNLDLKQIKGHEVSDLTRHGLEINKERYLTNHSRVQVFMLENDDKTVAVEVPLWFECDEMSDLCKMFKTKDPLTGHIDVLRIENNKIWVWDYKPNAYEEKYASTQIFFYALMLSKRINVSLDDFRCGYFDQDYAFVFKPRLEMLNNSSVLSFV
ncbi:MAG: PD-(D/E)XK nuclease family protein [archaeon]